MAWIAVALYLLLVPAWLTVATRPASRVGSVPAVASAALAGLRGFCVGRLIFHVFGVLAEFERDLSRERTQA